MRTWFRIAIRNLLKNRRRSLVTITAICLGFASVNLFGGFTHYMYSATEEAAIFGRAQGHLAIFKKGYLEHGQLDPAKYLLSAHELKRIIEICRSTPHVVLATPQLKISGLISNGRVSTIFIALGIVPSAIDAFMSRMKLISFYDFKGERLRDDKPYGVAVARGLARLLNLKIGSYAVLLTTTVEGQTNALDVDVVQVFNVDTEVLGNKVMRVPLQFAQQLYDTQGADNVAVLLDNTELTETVLSQLQEKMAKRGLGVEIRTWKELSGWYRKVKDMFDVIFVFIFVIVFLIVVMSVANTMTMAVYERTREIGTLRALGLKRRGVLLMFCIESSLLGFVGSLAGVVLTSVGWAWVDIAKPTWVPPGITKRIPLQIQFVPTYMFVSLIVLVILCVLASLVPARRGARQNIVDALGHV